MTTTNSLADQYSTLAKQLETFADSLQSALDETHAAFRTELAKGAESLLKTAPTTRLHMDAMKEGRASLQAALDAMQLFRLLAHRTETAMVSEAMTRLGAELGCEPAVTIDYDGPDGIIGIVDAETSEIMGAGPTLSEALEEAIATARNWRTNASRS